MYSNMYSSSLYSTNKRAADRRIDIRTYPYIGYITPTLFLAQHPQQADKKVTVKIINLHTNEPQVAAGQEAILKKVFGSSLYYLKPEAYDFQDKNLYLVSSVHPLSLQSMIWIHKREKRAISRSTVKNFTMRIFEGLARLKASDIFPRNLKPSNLFFQQRETGENNWVWSEAGLFTNNPIQSYMKISLQPNKSSIVPKIDPLQFEFYSLGVMLIEMMTLQPAQEIDKVVRNKRNIAEIQNFNEASGHYGPALVSIIQLLLNPPSDNSLNKAINDYKQYQQEEEPQPDYSLYHFTAENLQKFLKEDLLSSIEKKAKQSLADKSISARQAFDVLSRLDPHFQFGFTSMDQFQTFLVFLGVKLKPDELLFVSTYFYQRTLIRYFRIMQRVFPATQLIDNIIIKACDSYESFKEFFEAQTKGRDFWRQEEIMTFLQSLDIPFEEKDVIQTLKNWSGSDKTSIKYDQIYKYFKPVLGLSMSLSAFNKQKTEHSNQQSHLIDLMKQIMAKQPDLIAFFRKHDINQNWILDSRIEKVLKSSVKCSEQSFKKAMVEMWEKGNIPGDMSKKINYVYLIRNLEIYDKVDLLRKIVTQKVNQSDRVSFFQLYQKDQKGWTIHSLIDFNEQQSLDFDERELRELFRSLDIDSSGAIDMKELYFRLTGLKQFDYASLVENIKGKIERRGTFFFDNFKDVDPKARLVLGQPSQLLKVLESVGVKQQEISEDHLNQLYKKFERKGKFEYINFLFQFYPANVLFLAATKEVVSINYRGDFDKLFVLGLQGGKKKWSRESLSLVNDELVLGFREKTLEEVWKVLDPHGQQSLTKSQVAALFSYRFEEAQELTYKPLQNIQDVIKKRKQEDQGKVATRSRQPSLKTKAQQPQKQKNIIEEFGRLGERKLQSIPLEFFKQSESSNGQIEQEACMKILSQNGMRFHKSDITPILSRFKVSEHRGKIIINYIDFYFFIIDSLYRQEFPKYIPKFKGNLCKNLIKEVKKKQSLTNADLFKKCRKKDKMRLIDFEDLFKQLLEVEVMGTDLEEAWTFWGEQEYLNLQDFDNILETSEFKSGNMESGSKENEIYRPKAPEGNKMRDFISNEDELNVPPLKNMVSFGEKDPRFEKEREREGRSSKAIYGRKDSEDLKSRGESTKQIDNTGRFGPQKKKSLFASKPAQEKLQLQEKMQKSEIPKPPQKNVSKSKNQLFEELRKAVDQYGYKYFEQLFAKVRVIESKRFISCLTINYNFNEEDATALSEYLGSFGKVKMDALQSKIVKKEEREQQDESGSKSKQKGKRRSKIERQEQSKLSPNKDKGGSSKLVDPRRQKINVPMVKEHIRMLITSFCKRFEPSELQSYFFPEKDYISRQDFSSKCQSVSSTFTPNICTKIFDFLKPDSNDRVSLLTFKLATGVQEEMIGEQEDYLPEQLQKQLKIVFQKADKDRSGFIESNEIQDLLSSLGFNENIKQIENYFARMDQNFDNKISYSEFRHFIEDQILPQLSTFDEQEEQLEEMLRNNDIFRHGSLSPQTLQALLQRYGVKFNMRQIQILVRSLNPDAAEVNINHFMNAVRDPALYNGKIKAILYRIRLRKKVQLRQVQKVFENISSCFVLAYTSAVMHRGQLNISSPYQPTLHESSLFYNDLPIKDIRKVSSLNDNETIIGGAITNNDILVEVLLKEVSGVPIPQKADIKGNICQRYMTISIFDLSAESMKSSVWQVDAEWDAQVEDVWRFSNNVRSLIVKIQGYDPRKYQKCVLLFELVMVVVEGGKTIEINCGCTNIPIRELVIPEGKTSKTLKLIGGLPNRSKQIDKNSISKRTGWKSFFGSDVQSQLQMELVHQKKFQQLHKQIAALPSQVIFNRKALPYLWTFRQFIAQNAFDNGFLNRFLSSDLRVLTFLLSLDVPELFARIWLWWKDRVQSKIKNVRDSKLIFKILMQELYLIIHSKQFELLKKHPTKHYFHNKSLITTRNKLIDDVFDNLESWLNNREGEHYRRRKNYNLNYGALQIHEVSMPKEHVAFMENLARLAIK